MANTSASEMTTLLGDAPESVMTVDLPVSVVQADDNVTPVMADWDPKETCHWSMDVVRGASGDPRFFLLGEIKAA